MDGTTNNGQCTTGNSGTPPCDCYQYSTNSPPYHNAPNWGGQGGGCWMSGHGPAATTIGAVNSDGNVHIFLGCGNGGFQEFNGTTPDARNSYGQSVMDFRVTSSAYDTLPFQSFTPNTPVSGVGPALPSICGDTSSNCGGCGQCSYTFQPMNASDWDQSTGGVILFNDIAGTQRVVTADKAGYGYLLSQGSLCGPGFTVDTQCVGFAPGDPGSWTFGAAMTLCSGSTDSFCDRVSGMAFYDQKPNSAAYLYFWPNNEKLVGLELSDNSTTTMGQGPLSWTTSGATTLTYTLPGGGACTAGTNCLPDQVVPGDTLQFHNCSCSGSGCPVVTTVTYSSMTVNIPPPSACAINTAQNFSYFGYFVNPKRDYTPIAANVGFPGGAVTVSAQKDGSGNYIDGVVWAVVPDDNSLANGQRGLGTLYAYAAVSTSTVLTKKFASTDTWCSTSFTLPAVTNGVVYVPTFAVSVSGNSFTSCPTTSSSTSPPGSSGIVSYY